LDLHSEFGYTTVIEKRAFSRTGTTGASSGGCTDEIARLKGTELLVDIQTSICSRSDGTVSVGYRSYPGGINFIWSNLLVHNAHAGCAKRGREILISAKAQM
jgi:hypothetical protein